MQVIYNNALCRLISYSPNEIVQGAKSNTSLSFLGPEDNKILKAIRNLKKINTELAIKFAANAAKEYYNSRYTFIKLNVNNIIYLRLHKGYHLLKKPNYKILKQKTSLFYI